MIRKSHADSSDVRLQGVWWAIRTLPKMVQLLLWRDSLRIRPRLGEDDALNQVN